MALTWPILKETMVQIGPEQLDLQSHIKKMFLKD